MKEQEHRTLRIGLVALAALVVVGLLGGCLPRRVARADDDLASKETVTAFVGDLSAEASASGQVLPRREAALSFDVGGRIERVYVEIGDEVQAGDVLVEVESDALQRAVHNAEQNLSTQEASLAELRKDAGAQDIAAARAAVASAQAQLDDLLAGPSDLELADAEAALTSAEAQLADLLAGPGAEELARARTALVSAQTVERAEAARYAAIDDQLTVARLELDMAAVELESARYFYDALKNDWQHKDYADFSPEAERLKDAQTAYQVALARYNLAAAGIDDTALRNARSQVAQAEANLAALTEERTVAIAGAREQVALAQANLAALRDEKTTQIASVRAQLAQAEANLANLLEGATAEKLAIAGAQVEQARIQLADAQARLEKAALVAPFDGVVVAVNVEVGESAGGAVVEMVDPGSLEVVLDVDEVDIALIAVGQKTIVTLEAWPDRTLKGEVTAIAPRARAQSEVVTYQVHIGLDTAGLPVRTGMTANADLITSRRDNVLLVANRAISADRNAGAYYVYRVEGDAVEKVEVTIGLRDGEHTEITSGLREGDELVVGYTSESMFPSPGSGMGPGAGRVMGR